MRHATLRGVSCSDFRDSAGVALLGSSKRLHIKYFGPYLAIHLTPGDVTNYCPRGSAWWMAGPAWRTMSWRMLGCNAGCGSAQHGGAARCRGQQLRAAASLSSSVWLTAAAFAIVSSDMTAHASCFHEGLLRIALWSPDACWPCWSLSSRVCQLRAAIFVGMCNEFGRVLRDLCKKVTRWTSQPCTRIGSQFLYLRYLYARVSRLRAGHSAGRQAQRSRARRRQRQPRSPRLPRVRAWTGTRAAPRGVLKASALPMRSGWQSIAAARAARTRTDNAASEWAASGECMANRDWMAANCCDSCCLDSADVSTRCTVLRGQRRASVRRIQRGCAETAVPAVERQMLADDALSTSQTEVS